MAIPSNPHEASPKIGVLLSGGRKSLGGRSSQRPQMKFKNLFRNNFKSIGRDLGLDVSVVDGRLEVRNPLPRPMWSWRLSAKSSFCRAVVGAGLLTHRQMVHAAWRYRLGRSKDDAVIYWQIDQLGQVHDGKLMWYGPDCHRLKHRHTTWVTYLLKHHFGLPQDTFHSPHILFGTHLLANTNLSNLTNYNSCNSCSKEKSVSSVKSVVAIVEAEKSAVILSELYPQYLWLAAGGMSELQVPKFLPLQHYRVILFPDTDPEGRAFRMWYDVAQEVMRSFFWPRNNPIRVSPLLELHATPSQKSRKIDLVDFLFEFSVQTPRIQPSFTP